MNPLLRAKASVQVLQEAYEEKYKGRMKVFCTEEKEGDELKFLVITFQAFLKSDTEHLFESTYKVSKEELEKNATNLFDTVLMSQNHKMRERIVMNALGLPWENAVLK